MINYKQIKHMVKLEVEDDYQIKGIVNHHLQMSDNFIFILKKGNHYDPSIHLEKLCQKGIVLHEDFSLTKGYYISNLETIVKQILDIYYINHIQQLCLIGVCGTNGKSSLTHYIYESLPYPIMKISTGSIQYHKQEIIQDNTTPNEISLLHYLDIAFNNQIQYVVMEVSSQGIDQQRIQRMLFDYIIYTNIASDHLDYHKTLIHYRYSKYKLLNYIKKQGKVIVCSDELYYKEIIRLCTNELITYGVCSSHYQIERVRLTRKGSTFMLNEQHYETSVLGMENIYNLAACICVLQQLKIPVIEITKRIKELKTLQGRMQLIVERDFSIYVDYAHTSYAFYKSMKFFNQIKQNRLIVVVGCGGNREKQKRREIGYYASELSDICIFSEDNSREEKVEDIIKDMCERVNKPKIIIKNREEAIQYAIHEAQKNDIILVSGKGNEHTIIKNNKKILYNDEDVIRKLME